MDQVKRVSSAYSLFGRESESSIVIFKVFSKCKNFLLRGVTTHSLFFIT